MSLAVLPDQMSQRRAAAMSGLDRKTIIRLLGNGGLTPQGPCRAVSTAESSRRIGRKLTIADWDRVSVEMGRNTLAGAEAA